MNKSQEGWLWMPHPGHFCCSQDCNFILNTYVPSGYIISTVGEYEKPFYSKKIDIYIKIKAGLIKDEEELRDAEKILASNERNEIDKKFTEVRMGYLYETIIFSAKKNEDPKFQCCPYVIDQKKEDYEFEIQGYNDPVEATNGHYELCCKWSQNSSE